MKKKITIVDKDLNQLVVVADCSSALYQDRGTKLGEQNLLSDTAVTFKVYDGTAQVAVMMADILQVPTKQGTMADIWPTPANPLPDKQLAINYLCARNAERQMLCDKDPKDSVAMVLPITTHLYIDSIKVENAYKRRGIATGMLDFAVSLALPETIGLFCANDESNAESPQIRSVPTQGTEHALEREVLLLQAPQAPGSINYQEAFIDGI